MKKKLVGNQRMFLKSQCQLRAATGDAGTIHGEADVIIIIGAAKIKHQVLVADVEEDVIMGMDITHEHGFGLDLIKRIGTEEHILHPKEDVCPQILLA